MGSAWQRSQWLRVTVGSFVLTFLFMVFFAAVPSAFLTWSNDWKWVLDPKFLGVAELGPRVRDLIVVAYYGAITPLTFVACSLYQRLKPVNADADEPKRDAGGYR